MIKRRVFLLGALSAMIPGSQMPEAAKAADDSASGTYAELPGVKLWFIDTGGTGTPIILLHANTGTSAVWERQVARFSQAGYRVIAFDRRGWGKSVANPATGPQPGSIAGDLDALADILKLDRFHLLGLAGGGFAALDYAAWRPERLRSLVVAASTGQIADKEIADFIARIEIPDLRRSTAKSDHPIGAPTRMVPDAGSRSRKAPARLRLPISRCVRQTHSRRSRRSQRQPSSWPPMPTFLRRPP
jgi:pimeloyl-ACP methyl ester carboxylesterase